jgi:hypothetical protein
MLGRRAAFTPFVSSCPGHSEQDVAAGGRGSGPFPEIPMFRLLRFHASVLFCALLAACTAPAPEVDRAAGETTAEELYANPPEWLTAWYEYQTPGEEHRQLQYFAGTWRGEALVPVSSQCSPGCLAEMEMKYTSDLDGLFMAIRSSYVSKGCQSAGSGMKGFNRATHEYEWAYVKTTGSGMSLFKGSYDSESRTYTYTGDVPSEMGPLSTRITERIVDENTYEMDLYQVYDGELSHKVHTLFHRVR